MAFNRPASLSRKLRLDLFSLRRLETSARATISSPLRASVATALALSLLPMSSEGAGLGRLNLLSGLGQPLRAEIELTSVSREEAGSLVARLAGSDAFNQAKIEYGSALAGLRFSIQRRANGQAFVQVTSTQPVNEPYLDLLVELTWNSGRLVREYTMLLDPPELRIARREPETVVPVAPAVVVQSVRTSRRDASGAGRAGAASATAGTAGASGTSAAGGDYQVRRGDTAGVIARNNRPEGASLEQMLAALYRNNPQAFDGNVNRLKAGSMLRIPDASAATGVTRDEARRFLSAQTGDFSGYRSRLARAASETPSEARRGAGQQASGKLSARVEESGAPSTAKDQLRLSKSEAQKNSGSPTPSGTRVGAAPALSGPTAEDLAVKERALQEANTRVALLEKNVADLQKLVELKNQNLAELQKQAQKTGPSAATDIAARSPAAASPPASLPAPSASPSATPAPASAPAPSVATPAPSVPPPPVVVPPTPAPAPAVPQTSATTSAPAISPSAIPPKPTAPAAEEQGWFASFRDNPLMLGALALLAVLIVGYLLYSLQRRRRFSRFEDSILTGASALHANSVFGTTGGQSVDTSNSGFHSNFVPIAGATPEHNEVDPVAEADVYIAYGRDAQAEEILKESLRAHPERHAVRLKLLEIYSKRGDAKTFEAAASEMYGMTGGQGAEWKQAAVLGAALDPANPLYRDSAVPESPAIGAHPATADFDRTRAMPALDAAALGAMGLSGAAALAATSPRASSAPAPMSSSGLSRSAPSDAPRMEDMTRTDPLPKTTEAASTTSPAMDLDFDLGFGSASKRESARANAAENDAKVASIHRRESSDKSSHALDFDFGAPRTDAPDSWINTGVNDPSVRTAVNLPAFRSQVPEPLLDAPAFAPPEKDDSGSFTASDIFGTSISANIEPLPEPPDSAPAAAPARAQDFAQFDKTEPLDALSGISLDLDSGTFGETAQPAADAGAKTGAWQAMATKLDLAAAYRDIGDADGARELLDEVIKSGDAAQIDQARRMIAEFG